MIRLTFSEGSDKPPEKRKGFFGIHRLSVSETYLPPAKLFTYLKPSAVTALALLAVLLFNLVFARGSFLVPGEMSSNHANFGAQCYSCHATLGSPPDEKCSICHEKVGDQRGAYSFASHYLYKTDSLARLINPRTHDLELDCRKCHMEHRGRATGLVNVLNTRCVDCHFSSFANAHPDFEFIRKKTPDDSTLIFSHIRHVAEVRKHEKLVDVEAACLYCHNPDQGGRLFNSISFDRHCAACHLQRVSSAPLPAATAKEPGVFSLEQIREMNNVESLWARKADPTVFKKMPDGRIIKTAVEHKDEWLLFNLNHGQEWPWAMVTSDGSPHTKDEIIAKLHKAAATLRSSHDIAIQVEITMLDSILAGIDSVAFQPQPSIGNTMLIRRIAQPCLQCHILRNGKIAWVNSSQKLLARANFNHYAHIIQKRCLDCHTNINMVPTSADSANARANDLATVQNIPGIETCRQCHSESKAADKCSTCHYFHPNKGVRQNLVRYFKR